MNMRLTLILFLIGSIQTKAQIFEPGLISNNGVFGFTLSPKGDEAFWVQSNGGRDTLIIMQSHKVKGVWQQPTPATFSGNSEWKDIDPMFSPDGKMLLFQSTRPVESKPDRKGFDIWAVRKTKEGWGNAYHLGNDINSDASESFASITTTGTIYFMKENPNGQGLSDIYSSVFKKGIYQTPINIGSTINTPFRESNPFISGEEDFLIYFSSDSTGYGDVDLYISYKRKNKWTVPENLGKPINTSIGEFCPFYHQGEKRLYFSRTQQNENGRRTKNIYMHPFVIK
jgi:hypothetical protein